MRIINLLPPAEQKNLQTREIESFLARFFVWILIIFVVMVGILVASRFYLQSILGNIDKDIEKVESQISTQDNQKVKAEIVRNNNIINDYVNLAAANPTWSPMLIDFAKLVPDSVGILSFGVDAKTRRIDITGIGLTRDDVLLLRSNILASPLFEKINLPLENLEKATKTPFNYTFYLRPEVLSGGANAK